MKKDHKKLHTIALAICLSVMLCLILSGCASAKYKEMDDNIKYDPKPEFIDVVSMSVKEGSLTDTGMTVVLRNDSNVEFTYGEDLRIEKKENGEWKELAPAPDFGWHLIAYTLEPKSEKKSVAEQQINWEVGYGKLAPGEYRLIKQVFTSKELPVNESDMYAIAVEFVIK